MGKDPRRVLFGTTGPQLVAASGCCGILFVSGDAEENDLAPASLPACITGTALLGPVCTSRFLRKAASFDRPPLEANLILVVLRYARVNRL